jgi:hypothetical protein
VQAQKIPAALAARAGIFDVRFGPAALFLTEAPPVISPR